MSSQRRGESFVMDETRPIEFSTFVLGLASTALIHLGAAPNPESGESSVELPLAQESIDLLAMLREKTRGNLTPEEQKLLDDVLADLRLKFVQVSKR